MFHSSLFNGFSQISLMNPSLKTGLLLHAKKNGSSFRERTTARAGSLGAASAGMCTLHLMERFQNECQPECRQFDLHSKSK